jgi:hypothetical protein
MAVFFPLAEAELLITQFVKKTLPKSEWTHEVHLMTGLYHAAAYGEKAMDIMRERIRAYNEAVGTVNSDTHGYHETITHFWLWAVRFYCQKEGTLQFDQETLDDMLWTEELADRNLWLAFYSKELMLSTQARRSLQLPDIQDFTPIQ